MADYLRMAVDGSVERLLEPSMVGSAAALATATTVAPHSDLPTAVATEAVVVAAAVAE